MGPPVTSAAQYCRQIASGSYQRGILPLAPHSTSSGHCTFTPAAREFLERTRRPRLDKPFEAEALERLVAAELGRFSGA